MEPYQEEYLELLRSVGKNRGLPLEQMGPEDCAAALREANRTARRNAERGTRLLRENLFPVLDDILSASTEELDSLQEFAAQLMSGRGMKDVGLHYRIHMALMDYARHKDLRDMLIRELYLVGMALYNMETMLSSQTIRLFSTRMRMCFTECASYFETEYDQIEDPEIRGYIHRSMGNIALSYDSRDPEPARKKLALINRSIRILSDPDIRAKTPSLPWDLYLFKSHQERTSLMSYLRSGEAGPEAFAQVLESAQIVQQRQMKAARERGDPLQPRWQYAYLAARYHSGSLLLSELLDGLYALSTARPDGDLGPQSLFAHVSIPAYYMQYSRQLPEGKYMDRLSERVLRMTQRMCAWIVRASASGENEQLVFSLRQFLTGYRELPGGMSFFEVLQNVFAACHPVSYVRMWIAGRIARQLCEWTVEDCPEKLVGMLECGRVEDVIWRRSALLDFAAKAGRIYDMGMVQFFDLEALSCRDLFEEEEMMLQLHAYCGSHMLSQKPSTAPYADIALGHHRWYDEKGGFPVDFSLHASSVRPMICLVAAADALAASTEEAASRYRPAVSFDQAVSQLREGEGKQYAPFVTGLLRSEERRRSLRESMETWQREAYLDLYRRRAQAVASLKDG